MLLHKVHSTIKRVVEQVSLIQILSFKGVGDEEGGKGLDSINW